MRGDPETVAFFREDRLPRWLRWYLSRGTDGPNKRQNRSQLTANITFSAAALYVLIYGVCLLVFDRAFLTVSSVMFVMTALLLSVPIVTRRPSPAASITVMSIFCVLLCLQTYQLGNASGAHLPIMALPISILARYGTTRVDLLTFATLAGAGSFAASQFLFEEPALLAADDSTFATLFFTINAAATFLAMVGFCHLAFSRAERAEDLLEVEHARSEALLYNLLPEEIATRLKREPDKTIADSLPQVAILFADIVDFTSRSARMRPERLVEFLNRIFSAFDELAEKHGLEKIKTIGDAYMVAAGMPNPCGDPVHRVAAMALDVQRLAEALPDDVEFRIGLHAGPAVAGVIGHRKLFYDVWGETVNTASRMESHGEPGRVQVTGAAKAELEDAYLFAPRGAVTIKGLGEVETWWLTGAKN